MRSVDAQEPGLAEAAKRPAVRTSKRWLLLVIVGSGVVVVASGVGVLALTSHSSPPPAMAVPNTPGPKVSASIARDYCQSNYSQASWGMDDYGDLGFTTINCRGSSSGQEVSFGVFDTDTATLKAQPSSPPDPAAKTAGRSRTWRSRYAVRGGSPSPATPTT